MVKVLIGSDVFETKGHLKHPICLDLNFQPELDDLTSLEIIITKEQAISLSQRLVNIVKGFTKGPLLKQKRELDVELAALRGKLGELERKSKEIDKKLKES